jgi:chromosome segregation ATPase
LNFFPNFIAFSIQRCAISHLNGNELEEYPNLKWYTHFDSNVTRIPGNYFASTPNMSSVNFERNRIQHVGESLLDNLQDLQRAIFSDNICISKDAENPSEIPALIETLRQNCPDIEQDTTTTLATTLYTTQGTFSTTQGTTSTNLPPRCEIDDLEDFVCELADEIENLKETDEKLKAKNEILEGQVEELKAAKNDLNDKVENLTAENKEIREILLQLEQMVIDLTIRPCAC